jgi:hypothetical protein
LAFAAGLVAGTLVAPLSSGALGQVQRERDDALAQLTQANLWLTDWEEWRKKAGDERNDRLKQIVSKGRGHDWMALPVEEKATIGSGMVFAFREFFGSDATPWFYCDLLDRAFAGSTTFRNEPIREVLALAAGLAAGARENAKASSPQPPAPPATPGKAPRRY